MGSECVRMFFDVLDLQKSALGVTLVVLAALPHATETHHEWRTQLPSACPR